MSSYTEPLGSLVSELNLMHYIELLKRRWLLLVACGVLGAVATYFWATSATPMYVSRTEIAMLRTGAVVNFDSRFRTISDADPNAQGFDALARRRSLVTVGQSPAIAAGVVELLGDQLDEHLRTPEDLGRSIAVTTDGDVIRAQVQTSSPKQSALIANAWAEVYVDRLNDIFAESALTTDSLETQAQQAKADYDAKQAAVVAFIGSSPYEQLVRERDVVVGSLNGVIAQKSKLARLQANAESLRDLIRQGQGSVTPSQEFAKFLVEVNAFNSEGEQPFRMDVPFDPNIGTSSRAEILAELDEFIETLKARQNALGSDGNKALYAQLSDLNVKIERASATRKELEAARDLSWNTFQLLNSKVAENTIATETESQLVRVASPAVEPREPIDQRIMLKTLLGGMAGVVLGAALALVLRPN